MVAEALLKAGERIRVTGSDPGTFKQFAALGAEAITCDPTDEDRLTSIFQGGCGIYLALPHESKYREDFCTIETGSRSLCSGHSTCGYSPCSDPKQRWRASGRRQLAAGRSYFEESLNSIAGLNVLHLRPAHFLENLGAEILPTMNLLIGAIAADLPLSIVIPQDVANYTSAKILMLVSQGIQHKNY